MKFSFNLKGDLIHTDAAANLFFDITDIESGNYTLSNWLTDDDYKALINICK